MRFPYRVGGGCLRVAGKRYFLKPCGGGGGGMGLPFCDGAAKGEAGAAIFFLSCLGFFFSRLLRCSLLAISHLTCVFDANPAPLERKLSATAGRLKVPRPRPWRRNRPRARTGLRVPYYEDAQTVRVRWNEGE